jgi:hypothetical protein
MLYAIFGTRKDWIEYEAAAYKAWMTNRAEKTAYAKNTTAWSAEQQRRTDGKWIAPVCPAISDHSKYTIEESRSDWFLEGE